MISKKRKESILRILIDVDAQRLNPDEALVKIEKIYGFTADGKIASDKVLNQK